MTRSVAPCRPGAPRPPPRRAPRHRPDVPARSGRRWRRIPAWPPTWSCPTTACSRTSPVAPSGAAAAARWSARPGSARRPGSATRLSV